MSRKLQRATGCVLHRNAAADIRARNEEHMEGLARVFKDRLPGTVPTLPTRWLTEADTRLDLGGTVFEFNNRAGSRTPGDTLAWLP